MKRGRPKKDRTNLIGAQFNQLRIIGIRKNDRSGHPMCRTKCLVCSKETSKRLDDVCKGRAKTCECGSKQAFKDYMNAKIESLPSREIERIWCAVQDASNTASAAGTLKLSRYVVGFAARKRQNFLDNLPDAQKQKIWEAAQGTKLRSVGEQFDLRGRSVAYLVFKRQNPILHPKLDKADLYHYLAFLKSQIETRIPEDGEKWFRPHEFTSRELKKKRNGTVVGDYADLYNHLVRYPKLQELEPRLAKLISWFLDEADETFEIGIGDARTT